MAFLPKNSWKPPADGCFRQAATITAAAVVGLALVGRGIYGALRHTFEGA